MLFAGVLAVVRGQGTLPDQIRSAQQAGDYSQAAALYLQLIAAGTDNAEIRSNCGIMLHLAGKNREAVEQFRIALKRNPTLASANLFAGLAEFDLGKFNIALPYLQTALKLDPARPAPLLALAKTNIALRQYSAANEGYTKLTATYPDLAEAWFGLGVTDRSMADEILNKAVRSAQANSPDVKEKIQHLLDGALTALQRAAELEPNGARTHLVMAEALADEGKFAESVAEYEATIKLDPESDAAYLGLASEYWKQRQFDQAIPLLQHLLTDSPKDPEANGIMADISEHNGDNSAAKRYAAVALAGNPNLIETRLVLARIYLAEQKPNIAISELSKIASGRPRRQLSFSALPCLSSSRR